MTPRPPLLDTAEARGAVDVWAMPARRMGCVMERRAVRGVVMMGMVKDIAEGMVACMEWKERENWDGKGRGTVCRWYVSWISVLLCYCSKRVGR